MINYIPYINSKEDPIKVNLSSMTSSIIVSINSEGPKYLYTHEKCLELKSKASTQANLCCKTGQLYHLY